MMSPWGRQFVTERYTSPCIWIVCNFVKLVCIFISVINQLDAQNFCFTISLFHASTCFKHMCLKNVKQKFCASSWLITEINILRCTVSKTSNSCAYVGIYEWKKSQYREWIILYTLSCLYCQCYTAPNSEVSVLSHKHSTFGKLFTSIT